MEILKDKRGLFVNCPNCMGTFDLDTNKYKMVELTAYNELKEALKRLIRYAELKKDDYPPCGENIIKEAKQAIETAEDVN